MERSYASDLLTKPMGKKRSVFDMICLMLMVGYGEQRLSFVIALAEMARILSD